MTGEGSSPNGSVAGHPSGEVGSGHSWLGWKADGVFGQSPLMSCVLYAMKNTRPSPKLVACVLWPLLARTGWRST
jgi:hypothetical protein